MFSALDAIDDGAEHDSEINKDAAHPDEALGRGMHGAADEFEHGFPLRFRPPCFSGNKRYHVYAVSPGKKKKSRRPPQGDLHVFKKDYASAL